MSTQHVSDIGRERVNGTWILNPGCNLVGGFRRQSGGAGETSHPGNIDTVTTADGFVSSGQRHRLYLPKCGRPAPRRGRLQCPLPVDREKVLLSC